MKKCAFSLNGTDPREREIRWYLKHGLYPEERIAMSAATVRLQRQKNGYQKEIRISAKPYVIGDWGWNRSHPDKYECIEYRMTQMGVYS